jgi:Glycosyl transferase family 2
MLGSKRSDYKLGQSFALCDVTNACRVNRGYALMAVPDFKSVDLNLVRSARAAANDTGLPPASGVGQETIYDNGKTSPSPIAITIASPYFKDDPSAWIIKLAQSPAARQCEVVVVDDGSGLADVDARVKAAIDLWPGPAKQIRLHQNQGRAIARNRAIASATGEFILFIDADMMPGDDEFLARYTALAHQPGVDVAFGGFTTHGAVVSRNTRLHQNLAEHSDCKPASERSLRGPIAVASNNLLARRVIFERASFDTSFIGWGWEDTEWAMRVVDLGFNLLHIDNPAIHTGLDTDIAVLRKFKEASSNLKQLLEGHPEAGVMAGAKVARLLQKVPGQQLLRPIVHWIARDPTQLLPMVVRRMAAKYWRASWAAEALNS